MNQSRAHEWSRGVKALSVLLAVLVWLSVMLERPGEMKLTVPVSLQGMPAGMALQAPPPELQVVVSGPRVRLLFLPFGQVSCDIDLAGAGPGELSIAPTRGSFNLDREVKLERVFPEWITLVIVRK